jgi:hypothetical protein
MDTSSCMRMRCANYEAKDKAKRLENKAKDEAKVAENQRKIFERTLQVQMVNKNHVDSESWVLELMYLSPTFLLSSTYVPIRLACAKFDDNNTQEKKFFNSVKEKKLTVDLSFSKAQKNEFSMD